MEVGQGIGEHILQEETRDIKKYIFTFPYEYTQVRAIDIPTFTDAATTPVLFTPGFGTEFVASSGLLRALNSTDRRTLSFESALTGIGNPKIDLSDQPYPEVKKAEQILALLDHQDVPKVDIIAHSEGALQAAILGVIAPDRIRKMILYNPSGYIGDGLAQLGKRFTDETAQFFGTVLTSLLMSGFDELPPSTGPIIGRFLRNPQLISQEIQAIAQTNIRDTVGAIRENGIPVYLVGCTDDKLFPYHKMTKELGKHDVDGIFSIRGSHTSLLSAPEKYMPVIKHMLKEDTTPST
jgi:pimeloyl-ACP methyl ester carboxylesterase